MDSDGLHRNAGALMAVIKRTGPRILTGVKELDETLAKLKIGAANKIARPAVRKGGTVLLKKMKAGVPPNMKDAKRALGMVVDSKGGVSRKDPRAKVGVAVGKASKALPRGKRAGRPGVGIGGRNLHWWILGTDERTTGSKRVRSKGVAKGTRTLTGGKVHRTGRMPAQAPGLVRDAATSSKAEILEAIRSEAAKRLAVLAAKGG